MSPSMEQKSKITNKTRSKFALKCLTAKMYTPGNYHFYSIFSLNFEMLRVYIYKNRWVFFTNEKYCLNKYNVTLGMFKRISAFRILHRVGLSPHCISWYIKIVGVHPLGKLYCRSHSFFKYTVDYINHLLIHDVLHSIKHLMNA